MAGASPTSRTLAECRKRGWMACVVEKWIPQTKRRADAFGFGDILAVDPDERGALLIQATSGSHVAERVEKIVGPCAESARVWVQAGNRIEVWGWRKAGPRGCRKTWGFHRVEVAHRELNLPG